MAAADGLFDVYSLQDSLMWLWRAHNKVNNRIAGDLTEDPLHPKRQFPDKKLCPECFNGEMYDMHDVLQFLLQFYAVENFRGQGLDPVPVANLPSVGSQTSSDQATAQAADESTSTTIVETPSSPQQQTSDFIRSGGQSANQQSRAPVHTHTPPDHQVSHENTPAPSPGESPPTDQHGSSSILSVQMHRAPHTVRSSLPPPAVLPPQPGRAEVVPGIMRYPSEMAHVFPTVVRAAPPEEAEVRPGIDAGLTRTQRRVLHPRPRIVYGKPQMVSGRPRVRVVYRRPAVVLTQPRVVYSQPVPVPVYPQRRGARPVPEGMQQVYDSSGKFQHVMPVRRTQSLSHSVRSYWTHGSH